MKKKKETVTTDELVKLRNAYEKASELYDTLDIQHDALTKKLNEQFAALDDARQKLHKAFDIWIGNEN